MPPQPAEYRIRVALEPDTRAAAACVPATCPPWKARCAPRQPSWPPCPCRGQRAPCAAPAAAWLRECAPRLQAPLLACCGNGQGVQPRLLPLAWVQQRDRPARSAAAGPSCAGAAAAALRCWRRRRWALGWVAWRCCGRRLPQLPAAGWPVPQFVRQLRGCPWQPALLPQVQTGGACCRRWLPQPLLLLLPLPQAPCACQPQQLALVL